MGGQDLTEIFNVSTDLVSDSLALSYKKELSKGSNRLHELKSEYNQHLRNASVMNARKKLCIKS